MTRSALLLLIKISIGILLAALVIGYAIWGTLNYARGPELNVTGPSDGSSISSPTVLIQGQAERVSSISLNGNPLSMDQEGNFSQTIVVFPGANQITLEAHDQFGRTVSKELDLVGLASWPGQSFSLATTTEPTASSTATSTQGQ